MSFMSRIGKELEGLGMGNKKDGAQAVQPMQHYQDPNAQRDCIYQPANNGNQGGPHPAPYYAEPSTLPQPPHQTHSTPDKPTLPQGWTTLFDDQQQRWYYIEQATNRTQWEVPTSHTPSPAPRPPPPPPVLPPAPSVSDVSPGNDYSHGPRNYSTDTPAGNQFQERTGFASQGPALYPQGQNVPLPQRQIGQYQASGNIPPTNQPQQMYAINTHQAGAAVAAAKDGKKGLLLGAAGGLAAGAIGGSLLGGAISGGKGESEYEDYGDDY